MQKRKLLLTLSGLISMAITSATFACMSSPDGWYLEANAGSSHLSNKSYAPGNANQSGFAGNANFGYKFIPYIAAEMGYSRYTNNGIRTPDGTNAATDKHYSYDIAAKGILPISTSGVELFAKVGAERINSHVSLTNATAANQIGLTSNTQQSATGWYLGAGAQYYMIPEVALVVQWQRATGNSSTGNEDLFTGGVSFLFS